MFQPSIRLLPELEIVHLVVGVCVHGWRDLLGYLGKQTVAGNV
jgi:hypothetical protein